MLIGEIKWNKAGMTISLSSTQERKRQGERERERERESENMKGCKQRLRLHSDFTMAWKYIGC